MPLVGNVLSGIRVTTTTGRVFGRNCGRHLPFGVTMTAATEDGGKLVIGTHSGTFHCDEALACYMLKVLYPDLSIIRSRKEDQLNSCHFLVDVGGIYDPDKKRFDHHQASFQHTLKSLVPGKRWDVRLSSAGLVYVHYGKQVIRKLIDNDHEGLVEFVFDEVYENLIVEVDAVDNGVPMHERAEPLYRINTGLSSRVSHLNKQWNESETGYNPDECFQKAVKLVGTEFAQCVERAAHRSFPAREIVAKAIANRFKVHPAGLVIELPIGCPWKNHFFKVEDELGIEKEIMYVIFPADGEYRVQAVPINKDSFLCRKFLPTRWRGLRDQQLAEECAVEGALFAHSTGFIGGHPTRDGALEMALNATQS